MKRVLASSTGTGGDTVRRAFVHPTSSAAPTSGPTSTRQSNPQRESFCLYLPGMDSGCLQSFLEEISKAYPDHHLLVVVDGAPSHRSEEIVCPDNVEFLRLPAYSHELDPVERWFQEFRRQLSNRAFETVELLQEA